MRGKAVYSFSSVYSNGITPAYAGKSLAQSSAKQVSKDHPRVCGEKSRCPPIREPFLRITPAYAGKSFEEHGFVIGVWDHPRVCGEKLTKVFLISAVRGSPPRMRGKASLPQLLLLPVGITPAYAGKRSRQASCRCRSGDHPRVCGEKEKMRLPVLPEKGSPPRMRGKVHDVPCLDLHVGITPAYAGKRSVKRFSLAASWDHPRVCGEKPINSSGREPIPGSPPRMRGKVCFFMISTPMSGITPAYAGKRLKRSRSIVPHAAIVPLFPSVCNKPAGSDGSPAGHDAPPFLPIENTAPASPAYNLRSL